MKYKLDGLLTIPELAESLRVKKRTVRDWIEKRRIPFTKFGRRVYIAVGVVEDVLRRNAVSAAPHAQTPTLVEQGGSEQEGCKR